MSFSNPEHRNKALNRIREKVAAGLYIPGNRFVVPTKGDPLVLQIFRTMRSRNMSITEMSKRSEWPRSPSPNTEPPPPPLGWPRA
jgi:hypothetical protein